MARCCGAAPPAATRHWVLAVGIGVRAWPRRCCTLVVPSWTIGAASGWRRDRAASRTRTGQSRRRSSRRMSLGVKRRRPAGAQLLTAPQSRSRRPRRGSWRPIWLAGALVTLSVLLVGLVAAAAHGRRRAPARAADRGCADADRDRPRRSGCAVRSCCCKAIIRRCSSPGDWRRPQSHPAGGRARLDRRARAHRAAATSSRTSAAATGPRRWLGELLRAVYWFNPLVWIACRRLRQESEHACDDAVLAGRRRRRPTTPRTCWIWRARSTPARRLNVPAPAMARASSLEGRISAMLNARLDRRPLAAPMQIGDRRRLRDRHRSPSPAPPRRRGSRRLSGTVVDETNGVPARRHARADQRGERARHEVHERSHRPFRVRRAAVRATTPCR